MGVMKRNSLFYLPGALSTIPLRSGAVRPKIDRVQQSVARQRIGMDLTTLARTWWWEEAAWIVLWLCGLFGVGYCFRNAFQV